MSPPPTNVALTTALHEPQSLYSTSQHFHGCMKTWPEFLSAKMRKLFSYITLRYECGRKQPRFNLRYYYSLEGLTKLTKKTLVRIAGLEAKVWIRDLKQECQQLSCNVWYKQILHKWRMFIVFTLHRLPVLQNCQIWTVMFTLSPCWCF